MNHIKNSFSTHQSPPKELLSSLLEHYQNGRFEEVENLAVSITQNFPKHQFAWKVLGAVLGLTGRKSEAVDANQTAVKLSPQDPAAHSNLGITLNELGRLEEAEASLRQAIVLKPNFAEAHSNLGITLHESGRLEEAEASLRQAIALNADYAEAHSNLGDTLKELGRLNDAEASYKRAIALNTDYAETHSNLGVTLKELGRLEEAETSLRQAIVLKPDYAEAHSNLGITLHELGRLDEAEASYLQAIALNSDYAEAHSNLGMTLQELGRLEESESRFRKAIELQPDYAEAHCNLGKVLYAFGDKNSALRSIERANVLDPDSKYISLLLSVLKARKARVNNEVSKENITTSDCITKSSSKILLLNRLVEPELTTYLYRTKLLDLDKERDPSFGSTRGSLYDLFETKHPIIQKLAVELKSILVKVFKSDIFIIDSFFSIFGAGGGTIRHTHLTKEDKDSTFDLGKQKYSLVYYLSIGDQECLEPGFLKFYEPSEKILPKKGMITIFPANRQHSSVYGGNKDRVIVGANFYKL